jgi:hypothetical protein
VLGLVVKPDLVLTTARLQFQVPVKRHHQSYALSRLI